MKVTVNFGSTGVVVPCKDGWIVRDLIHQATQRYKKIVEQDGEFLVRTHHVEYADGGILDPDDMLTDLLEDKDKLIAVYEEAELQPRAAVSPGGSVASGYSSPYASEPELGVLRPAVGTEIEVTSSTLKSNTPLMVRSSSELVLSRSLDNGSRDTESNDNRPTTATGAGHVLTVKGGTMDTLKEDMNRKTNNNNNSSRLTRTVEISGDMGPLGIKVVPYLSSLSGRPLGLHVKGIEENSRTKREGIFEEDECIVQINDTELIDTSFAQSQEMFRQAMLSPVVRLEVLPMSNKLQYEKSLISQIFSNFDSAHTVVPKPKSPFMLRKADVKFSDPAPSSSPSSLTPPPREEPTMRRSPIFVERREQTPPPPVSASPTPRSRSESPASTVNPALIALTNANKKGGRKLINLRKGPDGLGFTVVTRDSAVHGPGPILVKSILPRGAAVKDGRLQSGDRILQVNGVDISGYRQEELVAMLRSTKQGETVSLLVSRQEEPFLPRELKGEPSGPVLSEDGREQLMYEIPVNDSGSAGLGLSLKGNKSRETGEDLGIFIKSIIHGGAAFKDGRLQVNDQLVAVNGESLLGRSNNDAMETLRRSMSMEGNLRGTIQLVILRAMDQSPAQERRQDEGQSRMRESSPALHTQNNLSNGVAQPPMVINSIYDRVPGPVAASNGRPGVYDDDSDEDEFPSPPSDMESDVNPQRRYAQNRDERELVGNTGRPTHHQLQDTQRSPAHHTTKASKSMDLVADEGNIGGRQAHTPAPLTSLGPTLGLQKSSSLESLQTAMEEASKSSVPFHRPAGPMVRGRGCNMSFRQAIDKSYDGPSEPEDDYSEDSSGRDTPVSGSSRQELEDGGKEKKKKTKKKKEKKPKTKKKDDADDPDKKTKKKGFGLLRFGKKNKTKGKLGSLSEEELNKSESEMLTETDMAAPSRGHLPDVEDDDFDPNYARINTFRDPPPPSHASYPNHIPSPHYVPPTGPAYNMPPTNEDPREGLYAKVNKIKPRSQPAPESNEARLQQIRSQLQQVKPSPSYTESGAGHRLQEYDPSRIRGPDPRMAPRYEDIDRHHASAPRRMAVEGHKEADRYLNPSPTYNANQNPQPASNRPAVSRSGPHRYDLPPSSSPGQQGVPSYEAAIKAGSRMAGPNQYGAYEDGQYPNHRTKNPAIGAV
ncbi:par-3 family cell polarity regulator beta a isoform X2 [Pangasianodon hypophthalmus]|uniref:par-3 family cell polarity regulator beta a isoform X2 n=2 Tax=Pangasianodon hypophthalmus TaxID=310915 RepID=UPI002307310C|nr:par-3 family cell polarity regulator beta a isoform X2 [Pangasianodon hypophthalmus]